MNIEAYGDFIVVELIEVESVSEGGIVLTGSATSSALPSGKILSGPSELVDKTVMLASKGRETSFNGRDISIMDVKNVIGVISD